MCGQSAETGQRYEYELECQAGRAAAGWPPAGDHRRPLRDPHAAAGTHQERRVLPERGQRGQTGHGRDQGTVGLHVQRYRIASTARNLAN